MRGLFSSLSPFFLSIGFAAIRTITGILIVDHGIEVFDTGKMHHYARWLNDLNFPGSQWAPYLGKCIELVGGVLLVLGLFTRLAALSLSIIMLMACFGIGNGKVFTDDQPPFLIALLSALFFFTGAGKWSVDQYIFGYKTFFRK